MVGSNSTLTPSSDQSAPWPSRRHSAHVGHDVVVWYRWHPYFERTVRCEYTEERAIGRVAHIVVRPGEVIVVPAWMLDREVCDASSVQSPTLGRPIAMGLVERGAARMGETVQVWTLGKGRPARIVDPRFYDPKGGRIDG